MRQKDGNHAYSRALYSFLVINLPTPFRWRNQIFKAGVYAANPGFIEAAPSQDSFE